MQDRWSHRNSAWSWVYTWLRIRTNIGTKIQACSIYLHRRAMDLVVVWIGLYQWLQRYPDEKFVGESRFSPILTFFLFYLLSNADGPHMFMILESIHLHRVINSTERYVGCSRFWDNLGESYICLLFGKRGVCVIQGCFLFIISLWTTFLSWMILYTYFIAHIWQGVQVVDKNCKVYVKVGKQGSYNGLEQEQMTNIRISIWQQSDVTKECEMKK